MKTLHIFYRSYCVGVLSINDQQLYQFQYDQAWLDKLDCFALSCSLPLQAQAFDHLLSYSFFSNLIPEGDLRYKIARLLGISEGNDFALLEAIGGEVAGAISLSNEVDNLLHSSAKQRDLTAKELSSVVKQLESQPFLINEEGLRLSLAGAQNKLPIIYQDQQFALPLGQTPSTHILKPDPRRKGLPQLAINEAFCMSLAKNCKLNTANVELINVDGQDCVLVQRYDRLNQQRLHQEDFCQAMGIVPFNKYESEGGPSFANCATMIDQYSSRPAADKKRLLHWTIFNYIIGNADAHGKNLSFLQQPKRVVSPFYDLLSTAIYPELNQRMSMKVGGENRPKWLMDRHWKKYCTEISVPYKMLQREAKTLTNLVSEKAELLAQNNTFSHQPEVTMKIKKVIEERQKWLCSRLGL